VIKNNYVFSLSFLHAFDYRRNEDYKENLSLEPFDEFKKFLDHTSGEIIVDKKPDCEFGKGVVTSIIMNSDRYKPFCKKATSKNYHINFYKNSNEFKELKSLKLKSLNYLSIDEIVEKWVNYSKKMMDNFSPDLIINWADILKRFDLKIDKVIIEDKFLYTGDALINTIIPIIKYFQRFNKGKFIIIGVIDRKFSNIDEYKIIQLKKLENIISPQNIELIILPSQNSQDLQHDRRLCTSFHTINLPSGFKNLPEGKKIDFSTEPSQTTILGDKESELYFQRLNNDLEKRLKRWKEKEKEKGFSSRA